MSWIPLSSGVIKSSLWAEEDWVIKIFLTMLADKGPGDIYTGTAYALAHDARKTEAQVMEAWKILSGPDRLRREKQIDGGARIRKVEGGWLIINAAEYRKRMSEELKRYRNAKAQKVWRQKQAAVKNGGAPLPGEVAAVRHGVTVHEHQDLPEEDPNVRAKAEAEEADATRDSGERGDGPPDDEPGPEQEEVFEP